MEFKELMHSRYSCRKFKNEKVADKEKEYLKDAIYCAPSARNKQPIRVWLFEGTEHMERMKTITPYHYNAPLTVAIGYVESEAWARKSDNMNHAIIDAAIAATQMWLAAADAGLGCVWVGDYDTDLLPELFPELKGYEILAFMQVGYPADDAGPIAMHLKKRNKDEIFKN